jgi:hypothetical protein
MVKSDIIHWKNMWNDVISDPDFRAFFLRYKNSGYYQIYKTTDPKDDTPDDVVDTQKKGGTLYMKFGSLGHYVAYKDKIPKKKTFIIFDSSFNSPGRVGTYSGCLPDFTKNINKYLGEFVYDERFLTPQRLKDDTFCQTWSLAYLYGDNAEKFLESSTGTDEDNKKALYNICLTFINDPVFKEICTDQAEWINKNFKINKAPKNKDADWFYNYSISLDYNTFKNLFE